MTDSLLIGETVIFTKYGGEDKGLVMGEVVIKVHELDLFPTTGYSVLLKDGTIEHIPYHKIVGIVEPDLVFLELLEKEGDLIKIEYPKYFKPAHPRGWNVESEVNNDMPF